MDKKYLIIYEDNYADEFDVEGFTIYTKQEYTQFQKDLKTIQSLIDTDKFDVEYTFGTNEEVIYEKGDVIAKSFKVKTISSKQAVFIQKTFNKNFSIRFNIHVGHFFNIRSFIEDYSDEIKLLFDN